MSAALRSDLAVIRAQWRMMLITDQDLYHLVARAIYEAGNPAGVYGVAA